MKLYLLILSIFFVSEYVIAQDSTEINVETPKIVTKLYLGKTYQKEDIQIKFMDVLTDSRCPKDVTCIWAGKVVALVEVYKNMALLEQKEVFFEPGKTTHIDIRTIFSNEKTRIAVLNVLPYPASSNEKIKKENYYLQLEISN